MVWTNDDLASATTLSGSSGSITPLPYDGTSDPATYEVDEDFYGIGETLWWKWTAAFTGDCEFDTRGSPEAGGDAYGLDTKISIYSGPSSGVTHADLTFVAHNDDDVAGDTVNSKVTFTAAAGTTYYVSVDQYGFGQAGTIHLSWSHVVAPPPPPPDPLVIDFVDAQSTYIHALDDNVLVPGYAARVRLDSGDATTIERVVLPGGWSTTTFYDVDTTVLWFDMPPLSEGVGSGALVLVQTGGTATASIDITTLYPEDDYHSVDPVLYDHVNAAGPDRTTKRTGASAAAAEAATPVTDTSWGPTFGYSYDGTSYKIEEDGARVRLSRSVPVNASPVIPTPPAGLGFGEFLTQQEDEQYPFGPTSVLSIDAYVGNPVLSIDIQEHEGLPANRWSQYGFGLYSPTEADTPLSAGLPDYTVVEPASWFTSGRRLGGHVGFNNTPFWGDDFNGGDVSNWDVVSGSMASGGGFVDTALHLLGAGSSVRVKAAVRPGAFEGGEYRMDSWIGADTDGNTTRVGMEFYDQSGALISTVWGDPFTVSDHESITDATWVSATAPAGTWTRGLILEFVSGSGDVWFDSLAYRVDSLAYPLTTIDVELPIENISRDGSGNGYALIYGATDAQLDLEPATHATENLRFGISQTLLTATVQPVGWRYWLPAPFAPTPVPGTAHTLRRRQQAASIGGGAPRRRQLASRAGSTRRGPGATP